MPDVRVDHVSFTYSGTAEPTLRSLNLRIREGEFVLLTGPSGCGKSTLALALTGIIPSRVGGHLAGAVYFGDRSVSDMELHEASQHIGMVFQNPDNQLVQLTVEEEVAFGPENLGLSHEEIVRRVDQALAYTGIVALRREQIYTLSGGQKQRVAIAATLAMHPQILVLDEPTSDLDPVGTQEVLGVLRELNTARNMTIVLIEHKVDEVISWVDRVLLMDQGRVVIDRPPRDAFEDIAYWEDALGVAAPRMVHIARAFPDVFAGATPLSVDEVFDALTPTPYADALRGHAAQYRPLPDPAVAAQHAPFVLEWDKVDLAYGPKQVLEEVTLRIREGEWVAIIGANGSGKTSLASLAMGFQRSTGGTICVRGNAVTTRSISRQAQHVGYLFQAADDMLFGATVEDEILFGVKHSGRRYVAKNVAEPFEHVLAMTDLSQYRRHNPFHLSYGQRKRLALGALLLPDPHALILDEPTSGQDEGHARAFLRFLAELRERYTYILITHDMRAVARYATRVVVLRDGHAVLDGPPGEVFACEEELALSGILPPYIAQLHNRFCGGRAQRVVLSVAEFVDAARRVEATT